MRPVLFELGDNPIYGYWFFYGVGLLLAVCGAMWLSQLRGLPFWNMWWLLLLSVIGAFLGARLSYGLFDPNFDRYGDLRQGGEVSFGGILFAVGVALLWAWWKGMRIADVLDCGAPSVCLAQGVQRIGCFCNGCCFGPVADTPLSVCFPKYISSEGDIVGTPCFQHHLSIGIVERSAAVSLPVIPTQLLETGICCAIAGIAVWLFMKGKLKGQLMWGMFLAYGLFRFGLQWLRPNYDLDAARWGWNSGHTMALGMVVIGILGLWLARHTGLLKLKLPGS